MKKLPVIIAAASALWVVPAVAGQQDLGPQSPGSEHMGREHVNRDIGSSMRGSYGESRPYGYDRESDMRRHEEGDWRYRHGEGMREGCKYITVRQRQGDEIIVRHFHRCD